ncbi:coagulation factor XIII A chain-like isoform X2 [Syngnathoides biaculeatus]|uniref:coagulation factor XIII A chain-like isoform X2 n=1 Tax=Syngnathoides biaculeatus TaxID=300417 RepID=UPI002ADDA637|nr:coagulation factor XIII A chain-like isoform X2 [Syngnathoides biaculeatus]
MSPQPSIINLVGNIDDFPEFQPFPPHDHEGGGEDDPEGEVDPRGRRQLLSVEDVDMCREINMPKHRTHAYDTQNLVVRRGQEFLLHITFSRPITPRDKFQLEFLIGSNPSVRLRTLERVTFGTRHRGRWPGRILDTQGSRTVLGITPPADTIVGKFRMYVTVVSNRGLQRTKRDPTTDCYMLFNCWNSEDSVYYPEEQGRQEYVLNDSGIIYMGSRATLLYRNWIFGQFERGILDACIYILDVCRMPIRNRSNAIEMVRKGSALVSADGKAGSEWSRLSFFFRLAARNARLPSVPVLSNFRSEIRPCASLSSVRPETRPFGLLPCLLLTLRPRGLPLLLVLPPDTFPGKPSLGLLRPVSGASTRPSPLQINAQDENGVLVGNWSENFSGGTAPTLWTGSVNILLQYANTGSPVRYGQCWVFAGVFNTFLRCLGIPARVISNFNSAHDNNGNLKIELIFREDGSADERNTHDSIWNYHCWNEVFMTRPDLPPRLSGWQVVDATPQETSDGLYRCGPASVLAIKEGLVGYSYDGAFIFAEVNSDVIYVTQDKYGNELSTYVDKRLVGLGLYTKHILADAPVDVTHTYKYQEGEEEDAPVGPRAPGPANTYACAGSAEETRAMEVAQSFGLSSDQPDPSGSADAVITVSLAAEQVDLGKDVELTVEFRNHGQAAQTVKALVTCAVIYYTGVLSKRFKEEPLEVTVPPNQTERVLLTTKAQEYMKNLGFQRFLCFTLAGHGDVVYLNAMKVVYLQAPHLQLKASGVHEVGQHMFVNVSFTNTFNFPLYNVTLAMEGPRAVSNRTRFYKWGRRRARARASRRDSVSSCQRLFRSWFFQRPAASSVLQLEGVVRPASDGEAHPGGRHVHCQSLRDLGQGGLHGGGGLQRDRLKRAQPPRRPFALASSDSLSRKINRQLGKESCRNIASPKAPPPFRKAQNCPAKRGGPVADSYE